MKKLPLALTAVTALSGSALAADLPVRTYTKAPVPIAVAPSWTGFYVFGGGGDGLWGAESNIVSKLDGSPVTRDQHLGGNGWFGTVGAGYDWQFAGPWVAGVFADGMFGSLKGSVTDPFPQAEGTEKLRTTWAVGARAGYLVAPNVYSYVNAGYTGSEWSGAALSPLSGGGVEFNTPSFHRDGWFVGGGVENSLNIFGVTAPGWFMKTEYRAAYFGRVTLPEIQADGTPFESLTFKPWVQTISTSLVYRFNSGSPTALAADLPAHTYVKAPSRVAAPNWTGFYLFGGGGGALWNADGSVVSNTFNIPSPRMSGDGWFGTVGAGYDWRFAGSWVAGVFGDGMFGSLKGSIIDAVTTSEGTEKLRTAWAAGARVGYLVAPNALSYVNAGYTASEWSGASHSLVSPGGPDLFTTPSFHRDGWFIGGGVENSLDIFGFTAPGLFMKTEYRAAYFDRVTLPEIGISDGVPTGNSTTFKPWVQTISTSLVYRFNSDGPATTKY